MGQWLQFLQKQGLQVPLKGVSSVLAGGCLSEPLSSCARGVGLPEHAPEAARQGRGGSRGGRAAHPLY